jgi:hypothetical protein
MLRGLLDGFETENEAVRIMLEALTEQAGIVVELSTPGEREEVELAASQWPVLVTVFCSTEALSELRQPLEALRARNQCTFEVS